MTETQFIDSPTRARSIAHTRPTADTKSVSRESRSPISPQHGGADRADDAAQELWIDVFRSLPKLRDPGAFAPWVYRLARDRAYRVIRSAKPQAADVSDIDIVDESDNDEFSPEDASRVHEALDQLNPEHREVLLLRFVESMTYPQIATIVGCELGTVRSRLHYAKRALRSLLERNEHERVQSGVQVDSAGIDQ